jgi:hypothetical protein
MHQVGTRAGLAGIPCALISPTLQLDSQATGRVLVAVVAALKHSLRKGFE